MLLGLALLLIVSGAVVWYWGDVEAWYSGFDSAIQKQLAAATKFGLGCGPAGCFVFLGWAARRIMSA